MGRGRPAGDELFTLTFPRATLERGRLGEASSTLLHFRQGLRPAVLPFAGGAAELGWGLAVTPDGATLALVAAHGSDGHQLDLYARAGAGIEPTQTLAVSGPDWSSVVSNGSRIVVVTRALVAVRPDELPDDVDRRALRAWALSGPRLVALHGGEILWWSLDEEAG